MKPLPIHLPHPRRSKKVPVIRRALPPGASPGTLTVDPTARPPRVTVIGYGPDDLLEAELEDVDELDEHLGRWPVLWINVDGLGDHDVLRRLGEKFSLHQLALEDVVNVHQRAKVEPYDEHLFIVARMIVRGDHLGTEQVSLFLGEGFVLTFQETEGDPFDQVRRRIRTAEGRIRRSGPDYLVYALIDSLIDAYYPVLEQFGDELETLEEHVLESPEADLGVRIHTIKRELLMIRRALAPHREAVHTLLREQPAFMQEDTRVYMRDCYDHVIQLLDMVETYRELSSGLLDVHLATVSNRMNEVMKVLTIFAATFIPLSFIAGLYGMNFSQDSPWNMPELRWAFGYPAVLLVMAGVVTTMFVFFRRRGWIGGRRRRPEADDEAGPRGRGDR